MKYLFFDIECCDGIHICEFGYVITDEQFHVLSKECLIMNPEAPFNLTGRKGGRDLYLTHSEEEYRASPIFTAYYDKIKQFVSLSVGESDDSVRSLYDKRGVEYTVLEADVYATDYISGYDLLLTVKSEIENAVKSTVRIIFKRFPASEYDERLQRHVLRSQYKIIE